MSLAGKFISLEGIEGVGKSTQSSLICAYLEQENIDHVLTREPGGTAIAEDIRKIILEKYHEPMHDISELLLLYAARAQHIFEKITPALESGKCVICDRFNDASFAYQGGGRGLGKNIIQKLDELVVTVSPDLTIILDDSDVEGCLKRARNGQGDRIEQQDVEFFVRVRNAYLLRASSSSRYKIIKANDTIESVFANIQKSLNDVFESSTA